MKKRLIIGGGLIVVSVVAAFLVNGLFAPLYSIAEREQAVATVNGGDEEFVKQQVLKEGRPVAQKLSHAVCVALGLGGFVYILTGKEKE